MQENYLFDIRELLKTVFKDVPLWAQYIGKNRFLLMLILRMKAVFRCAHKSPIYHAFIKN